MYTCLQTEALGLYGLIVGLVVASTAEGKARLPTPARAAYVAASSCGKSPSSSDFWGFRSSWGILIP